MSTMSLSTSGVSGLLELANAGAQSMSAVIGKTLHRDKPATYNMSTAQSGFLKACRGENTGRLPIWIMRQAGRYLPEYLEVRKQVSFLDLCRSPKLIAEVVHQPIHRFGLDAAILFSDILTILEPMGVPVTFPNGGPQIAEPIRSGADVDRLHRCDIANDLSFVFEGIRQIKRRLPGTPLLGFAGSPITLACYLIEGKGSKTFDEAKQFLHRYPAEAERMFDLLADTIAEYLRAQIEAGADAVQLFDSWGGMLSYDDYKDWSARYTRRIFDQLKHTGAPRILFVNNIAPYLPLVNEIDCEVVGVDYRIDIAEAMRSLPGKAIQGNLDPAVLFESEERVIARTRHLLDRVPYLNRFIFNLGHGIRPGTPVESVAAVVKTVHSYR